MAEVTAVLVKELRDKTGAGMMDCKRALGDTGGDIEGAVDWLRKKGLAAAAKKSGRVAAEGLVGVATRGRAGAAVEVNSETDFVARNELFQVFVRAVGGLALGTEGAVAAPEKAADPGTSRTVGGQPTAPVAAIGCEPGAEMLGGGRAPGAGLRDRRRATRRQGHRGGRQGSRRADPGRRVCLFQARRGGRSSALRFRRRGRRPAQALSTFDSIAPRPGA